MKKDFKLYSIPFGFFVLIVSAGFFLGAQSASAQAFTTKADQALLMDFESGSVFFQKNANQKFAPASTAKLMSMEVVFHALKSGKLTMDDKFSVSEDAWRRGGANSGGSSMFAKLNSEIRLEDLIYGVIVQSGNDAAIVIAEGMAGTEVAFAGLMNDRAKIIGMSNSTFRNATGLPHPDQVVTAIDLAKLTRHIIRTYPELYKIYSVREFSWSKINQYNRNPLLSRVKDADGLKTGYTKKSGYAIVGSAEQDGRRLIQVLSGLSSRQKRIAESVKMMRWGFRGFEIVELFKANDIVGEATVYGGEKSGVALRSDGPLRVFVPIGSRNKLEMNIVFKGPIATPVQEGLQLATLQVKIDGKISQETPLYTAERVERGSIPQRAVDAVRELIVGLLPF